MNRLEELRKYVDSILEKMPDSFEKRCAYIHLYGVSEISAMLAIKRNLDPDIAAAAGMLHDIYAYRTGIRKYHSNNSAEDARPIIRDMGLFKEEERLLILSAVFHHADKDHIHDEYDEVIKDADILQQYLYNPSFELDPKSVNRLKNILKELGLNIPSNLNITLVEEPKKPAFQIDKRSKMADVAEALASKPIEGNRNDSDFMDIVKYWPDTLSSSSFDELVCSWCAAFVFHCCMQSGIQLPIRYPNTPYRLACVEAWYEWAVKQEVNLFIPDSPGFMPEKGDIVIYDNVISPDRKPENSGNHDHMGIVLSCTGDLLSVAEGNTDNSNISAIVERKRGREIAGYIRISNDYRYEGWKFDYKTGKCRVEPY